MDFEEFSISNRAFDGTPETIESKTRPVNISRD
jgi:hypothetical protein